MSETFTAGPPDTGGVDLGPIGQLHGTLPGLRAVTTIGADVAPSAALWAYHRHRRPAKDYNDQPTDTSVGTEDGNVVKDPGPDWMPPF